MSQTINRRKFVATTAAAGVGLAMTGTSVRGRQACLARRHAGPYGRLARLGPVAAVVGAANPRGAAQRAMVSWRRRRKGARIRGGLRQAARREVAAWPRPAAPPSLITALHVVGVDAGDEVICSPFTFIATYNAILSHKAPAGVRRHRSGHAYDGPGHDREPHHRPHAGHRAGPHLRHALRHGRDQRHRQTARAGGCRRRLPGVAGRVSRPKVRHARRPGLLQLPEFQAPSRGRRRRRDRQQRRARWTAASPTTTAAAPTAHLPRQGPFHPRLSTIACNISRRPCSCSRSTS